MTAPFATPSDYELRTAQVLSATKRIQVGALLEEASELMRGASPDLDTRAAAGQPASAVLIGVAVRVVERYLANPTLASQLTKGPFSVAYAAANARGLFLTDEDLTSLLPPAPAGQARGVGTIRLGLAVGTARPYGHRGPRWPR